MRRQLVSRITAIAVGALMLATMVPVAVPSAVASAAPFAVEEARASAPDGAEGDNFGQSVAVSGDTMVVGAPWKNTGRGAVYVFFRTGAGWAYQATLVAPGTPSDNDHFGTSVAIDGDVIVVGAPYYYTAKGNSGAAFTFQRTGAVWSTGVILPAELEVDGDRMGEAVAIQGSTIVVGCPGRSSSRGALRPFRWTGTQWTSDGGVTISDPFGAAGDRLGASVAIDAGTIMAGEPGDDYDAYLNAGSIVAFTGSGTTWAHRDTIHCPNPVAEEQFGGPIDLTDGGTTAIVGRMFYDTPGNTDIGCAYIFSTAPGYWALSATLSNPGPNSPDGDNFGSGVAIDGDLALIGAFWDDSHTGAAYYYQYGTAGWTMVQKATPSASPFTALFGDAVALDNGTAVIGAPISNSATVTGCGAAFVYNSRAIITGICRSAVTGLPLAGVEVQAHYLETGGDPSPASNYVVTDANGRYTISVDSRQCYVNHLGPTAGWAPGWYNDVEPWAQASPTTVWAGTTTTINFTIYPKFAVFRFYNFKNNTHFFTDSLQEKNLVLATWPDVFRYEGISYVADPSRNPQPLYRFFNRRNNSHFYTASEAERDMVLRTWPDIFQYDGPTYHVSPSAPTGVPSSPVYRFYNLVNGSHFYTADPGERDAVIANYASVYKFEGPAFWIAQ